MVVRIAILCMSEFLPAFQQGVWQFSQRTQQQVYTRFYEDSVSFLGALHHNAPWDLVIVAATGARGMEIAISARNMAPHASFLWCSDDAEFAVASYRLRCSLFLSLPVRPEQVEAALMRCLEDFQYA